MSSDGRVGWVKPITRIAWLCAEEWLFNFQNVSNSVSLSCILRWSVLIQGRDAVCVGGMSFAVYEMLGLGS